MKYFSILPSTTSRSNQGWITKPLNTHINFDKRKQNKNTGEGVKQTNEGVKHFLHV